MHGTRITAFAGIAGAALLLLSCSDGSKTPTAVERAAPQNSLADLTPAQTEPFTYRAPIDPYKILRLPEFMMQERVRSDIVMQRSVFAPGLGAWHTHSGPSFIYVIQGQIKLREYSPKDGCVDTPVRGPGEVYFETGDDVHRAIVVSSVSAVLMVTRFNIPVGGPITVPAADPGC